MTCERKCHAKPVFKIRVRAGSLAEGLRKAHGRLAEASGLDLAMVGFRGPMSFGRAPFVNYRRYGCLAECLWNGRNEAEY